MYRRKKCQFFIKKASYSAIPKQFQGRAQTQLKHSIEGFKTSNKYHTIEANFILKALGNNV